MEHIDRIFTSRPGAEGSFAFDGQVAEAFDDMANRSIPFYAEFQKTLPSLIRPALKYGERIYDLGCSTGTTLCSIAHALEDLHPQLVGVDSSAEMIAQCQAKLKLHRASNITLSCSRIEDLEFEPCAAAVFNYTLQFLNVEARPEVLTRISEKMRPGAIVVISEKCLPSSQQNRELMDELYHDFKGRNGYSPTEIARKQSALKGVLKPLTLEENLELLGPAGFGKAEILFKSYQFCTYFAYKV